MELKDLYRDVIVDHNRHPRNFRPMPDADRHAEGFNPLCGDRLTLYVKLDGERISAVRLAFGGLAGIVKRAALAEAALLGQPWNENSLAAAQAALAEDFTPLSDMRASADYRRQVAANLLQRFWLETRTANPLPASATSVFATMTHEEA